MFIQLMYFETKYLIEFKSLLLYTLNPIVYISIKCCTLLCHFSQSCVSTKYQRMHLTTMIVEVKMPVVMEMTDVDGHISVVNTQIVIIVNLALYIKSEMFKVHYKCRGIN